MIFLISYDRRAQKLTQEVEVFEDDQRALARRRRLEVELAHDNSQSSYGVVLLEASSREAIAVSHARYFSTIPELFAAAKLAVSAESAPLHNRKRTNQ